MRSRRSLKVSHTQTSVHCGTLKYVCAQQNLSHTGTYTHISPANKTLLSKSPFWKAKLGLISIKINHCNSWYSRNILMIPGSLIQQAITINTAFFYAKIFKLVLIIPNFLQILVLIENQLTVISRCPSGSTLYLPPVSCSVPFLHTTSGLGEPKTWQVRVMVCSSAAFCPIIGGVRIVAGSAAKNWWFIYLLDSCSPYNIKMCMFIHKSWSRHFI